MRPQTYDCTVRPKLIQTTTGGRNDKILKFKLLTGLTFNFDTIVNLCILILNLLQGTKDLQMVNIHLRVLFKPNVRRKNIFKQFRFSSFYYILKISFEFEFDPHSAIMSIKINYFDF